MALIYDPTGEPIEIADGRGDLRYSSQPFDAYTANQVDRITGRTVSYADLFATQMWVASAVMRLLTSCVRVPLKAYRRTGDESRQRERQHPLAQALVTPWEGAAQAQLVMSLLGPLLVHGNALTDVEQGRSDALRFNPFDWRTVTPITAFRRIAGWKVREDNDERNVGADTAMHIAWWSPLGPTGVSPLQQLGVTLSIESAAQRYQQALFRNGARPPSAIETTTEFLGLEPKEREALMAQLRGDVNAIYAGPENAGRPAILPPGLEWKPVGHTAVEAELIDQRKVAREEVAAVYQIPPPMIGILDKATYANIETQREMYFTDSLGPPLVLIEQIINAHLVQGLLREPDLFVEFDFAGVLRGDRLKEIQALREAIGTALMKPNEGRAVLNLPASDADGMDDFYLPGNNLTRVSDTGASRTEDPAAVTAT